MIETGLLCGGGARPRWHEVSLIRQNATALELPGRPQPELFITSVPVFRECLTTTQALGEIPGRSSPNTQTCKSSSGNVPSHRHRSRRYSQCRPALGHVQKICLDRAGPTSTHSGTGHDRYAMPSSIAGKGYSLVDISSEHWSERTHEFVECLST